MTITFSLYEPREDSYLLADQVEKYARGRCLDIGCGTGIQAMTAAKKKEVKSVLAADIQSAVIEHCRKHIHSNKITYKVSDLFSKIKGTFDMIIFNPPYLPDDPFIQDIALDGGKHGSELLERFIRSSPDHLTENGQILVMLSTRTNPERVHEIIKQTMLDYTELSKEKIFFEELMVYQLKKTPIRKELEKKGMWDIYQFAKGHRGVIYKAKCKSSAFITTQRSTKLKRNTDTRKRTENSTGKSAGKGIAVAIKIQRQDSPAKGTVDKEYLMLKSLNVHHIGPKVMLQGKNYFVYRFVEGIFIDKWVQQRKSKEIKEIKEIIRVIIKVFNQMRTLDKLQINKEEMHHPHKHILISKNSPTLLDFERAKKTIRPKNVTQFCQYVRSTYFGSLLKEQGVNIDIRKLMSAAKRYSHDQSNKKFREIINLVGLVGRKSK